MIRVYRSCRGATTGQVFLLLLFVGLLIGFAYFKGSYGVTGHVVDIPTSTADEIVFVRQDGGRTNLFLAKADGSEVRQLTDDKANKRAPSWSPDGKQIVYSAEPENPAEEGRAFQIFIKGKDAPKQITRGSQSKDLPQFRPDGKLIGFLSGGAIKVVEPNGSGLRQVYPPPHKGKGGSANDDPSDADQQSLFKLPPLIHFRWAPGSVSLAATQLTEGQDAAVLGSGKWWKNQSESNGPRAAEKQSMTMEPETVVMLPNVETDKPVPLLTTNANKVGFSWYPDGIRLAVAISTRRNAHAIGLYRTDDPQGNPSGLFASTGFSLAPENPEVSPDGRKIAFEVWRMDSTENRELLGIAVLPIESQPMIKVTKAADLSKLPIVIKGDAHHPLWSPDGTRLLYWSNNGKGRDIWVAAADGSHPVSITKGAGDNSDAAWSPVKR